MCLWVFFFFPSMLSILPPFPVHCEFPEGFHSCSHLQPQLADAAELFSASHLGLLLLTHVLALIETWIQPFPLISFLFFLFLLVVTQIYFLPFCPQVSAPSRSSKGQSVSLPLPVWRTLSAFPDSWPLPPSSKPAVADGVLLTWHFSYSCSSASPRVFVVTLDLPR